MLSIDNAIIETARSISGVCLNVSRLSDAVSLLKLMDSLCLGSVEIEESQEYDDNNYFTCFRFTGCTLDENKLKERGGLEYLLETLDGMAIQSEFEDMESVSDYLSDWEFLEEHLGNSVCAEEVSGLMSFVDTINYDELEEAIDNTIEHDIPRLKEALVGLS